MPASELAGYWQWFLRNWFRHRFPALPPNSMKAAELRSADGRSGRPYMVLSDACRLLSDPLVYPVVYGFVPELGVLRLQDPVAFVGEVEHL